MKAAIFLLLTFGMLAIFSDPVAEPRTTTSNASVSINWSKEDSRAYARDKLSEWQDEQWSCLNKLWGKESAWNPKAYNTIRVMGKNAGGIPQLLGLDPDTPAPRQIDRGLAYIYYRYGTPCEAWAFFKTHNWH